MRLKKHTRALGRLFSVLALLGCVASSIAMPGNTAEPMASKNVDASATLKLVPKTGTAEYEVTNSEGQRVGLSKIVDRFDIRPDRYRISSTLFSESTQTEFVSEGSVTGGRLIPNKFYRTINKQREFTIDLSDKTVTAKQQTGTPTKWPRPKAPTDIVSSLYQAASITKAVGQITLDQVHIYGIDKKTISFVNEEMMTTALGTGLAMHLQSDAPGARQDIWVAPGQQGIVLKFTIPANGRHLIATLTKVHFQ